MEIEVRALDTFKGTGRVWHKKNVVFHYHREDGPAVIYDNPISLSEYLLEEWWYYNYCYTSPNYMPLNLFLAYVKWEYKKNGN